MTTYFAHTKTSSTNRLCDQGPAGRASWGAPGNLSQRTARERGTLPNAFDSTRGFRRQVGLPVESGFRERRIAS